jgi:cytochrome bd-type quinol oxidase subunit 2
MKNIKILFLGITSLFVAMMAVPAIALAVDCSASGLTAQEAIECGSNNASGQTGGPSDAEGSLNQTIKNIVNILSVIVGVVAVIMIIIAGLRYITSGGSAEGVATAKRSLLYAIIGLVVVALAQIIVRFVLTNVTNPTSSGSSTQRQGTPANVGH